MSKWWDMWFVYRCPTDGGRDSLRWPALSRHWLFCTGCRLCLLSMKLLMCRTPFLHITTSLWFFCPRTIFTKNSLDMLPRTPSIWDLHTILRIISIGVPSLATDSPCGIWGRGWTAWLLYDGPLLVKILSCQLVWTLDMVERDFSLDFLSLFMFYTLPKF